MSKPTIVILHGWGLSGKRFLPLAGVLKKNGYQVFAPDFPGFGESELPSRPFTLSDYVNFLDQYIQKKRLDNYVLIGHSFGGRVTLKYCTQNREGLRGIILTGTPGFTPVAKRKLFFFIFLAKAGKLFFSFWPLSVVQEKMRAWYYYIVGAKEFYRAQGVMRDTFKLIVSEELLEAMHGVRVPTLLVWGELDQITPMWIARKMHPEIASSKLVIIPNHGHGVPLKDPKIFVKHITPFLRTL